MQDKSPVLAVLSARHKFINVSYKRSAAKAIYQDSGIGLTSQMQNY